MRHGSLFSGIGGFDLAAEWMGWENVFHCEWNEFGQKVLHHYWPNAETFTDITKSDFTKYANKIDILTGGFPCQPYSMAGKRKGKEDERHLWPQMLRAIREIKPKYIVGENVFGLLNWNGGLVFDEVHSDLEFEGYEVQAVVIPAAAVNAPHGRDRVWFVATNTNRISNRGESKQSSAAYKQGRSGETDSGIGSSWEQQPLCDTTSEGDVTNSNGNGFDQRNGNNEVNASQGRINAQRNIESIYNEEPIIEHSNGIGQERRMHKDEPKTTIGKQFSERNARSIGTPTWDNFPTQSPICGGDDGIPTELDGITFSKWRNESIKAYGNAIVPQVAYEIFKAIQRTI
jgi:DNA (cytosine-5)-methyltransferase 1